MAEPNPLSEKSNNNIPHILCIVCPLARCWVCANAKFVGGISKIRNRCRRTCTALSDEHTNTYANNRTAAREVSMPLSCISIKQINKSIRAKSFIIWLNLCGAGCRKRNDPLQCNGTYTGWMVASVRSPAAPHTALYLQCDCSGWKAFIWNWVRQHTDISSSRVSSAFRPTGSNGRVADRKSPPLRWPPQTKCILNSQKRKVNNRKYIDSMRSNSVLGQ